jgi:hypothetical protein
MADRLKVTQSGVQVEYTIKDQLGATQFSVQVESSLNTDVRLSHLFLLVDYNEAPLVLTSQVMLQVEYEEVASYTGTPPAIWVVVYSVPPSTVLIGEVLVIGSPSWAITKAFNPVVNKPAQSRLMRHGKYYFANVEKPYYWAGHDV